MLIQPTQPTCNTVICICIGQQPFLFHDILQFQCFNNHPFFAITIYQDVEYHIIQVKPFALHLIYKYIGCLQLPSLAQTIYQSSITVSIRRKAFLCHFIKQTACSLQIIFPAV
uniref:Uncharacterized protein n=1 Tax=Opuntia streptacantha TaxID=393608 RepID=A0A7C9EI92_OPUST